VFRIARRIFWCNHEPEVIRKVGLKWKEFPKRENTRWDGFGRLDAGAVNLAAVA